MRAISRVVTATLLGLCVACTGSTETTTTDTTTTDTTAADLNTSTSTSAADPCASGVMIFWTPETALNDLEALADELRRREGIDEVAVWDQAETYDEFTEIFADNPEIVDTVSPDILPPSIRLTTDGQATIDELRQEFEARPGVREFIETASPPDAPQGYDQTVEPRCGPDFPN